MAIMLASQEREVKTATAKSKGRPKTVSGAIVREELLDDEPRRFPRMRRGRGRQRCRSK